MSLQYFQEKWSSFKIACHIQGIYACTISWDDAPRSEGGVDATHHPEHAEPAEMFSSLIHLQEFREVGIHDWDRATDPARQHGAEVQLFLPTNIHYLFLLHKTSVNGVQEHI